VAKNENFLQEKIYLLKLAKGQLGQWEFNLCRRLIWEISEILYSGWWTRNSTKWPVLFKTKHFQE